MNGKTVTFDVGEKTYTLSFDYNAIADIEEAADCGIASMFSEKNVGMRTMRYLFWGGLKVRNPGLTKQKAGDLIERYIGEHGQEKFQELSNRVIQALVKSVGGEQPATGDEVGE
jgi:hypothetical protein